ncbi:MAG: ABC transporter substrate-binding protein, partial [Candidatus Hodarchaeales archaeon]
MKKKRAPQVILFLIYFSMLASHSLIPSSAPVIDVEGEALFKQQSQTMIINADDTPSLLRYGNLGNPYASSDPAIYADVTGDQWRRHSLLYNTLVDYDPETGLITPSLAKQWVVSNDSKYWVFTLKQNIFFHDGSKFNASSVKFTFSRLFDPTNPAYVPKEDDLPLKSIEIKSEYELIFNFFEPHSPFIYDEAATLFITSPNSFNGSTLNNPIGTGPYRIDLSSSNLTFQNLTRFTEHFRGLPPFEQIHYRIYTNYNDLVDAIVSHEVDIVPSYYLDTDELYLNDDYWNLTVSNKSYNTIFGWFNQHDSKIANSNVRLALNHAINRQSLIDLYGGYASKARSIVPPSAPFYDNEVVGYPYNVKL